MSVLEAVKVWKVYGATIALKDVSLSMGRGLHVIVGPNGSGKTTLLKLWAGLARPTRGLIRVLGFDPWRRHLMRVSEVSAYFEGTGLPWWQRGIDYLKLVASLKGVPWGVVAEIASELGVDSYWTGLIRGYSSGMRKRLALAAALAGDPEVLLLDEPYTLLDSLVISRLMRILREKARRSTIVVATHIITELEERADTVTLLHNGRVVAHGDIISIGAYIHECSVEDPVNAIKELWAEGVKSIVLDDNKLIIRGSVDPTKAAKLRCVRKIDYQALLKAILKSHEYT